MLFSVTTLIQAFRCDTEEVMLPFDPLDPYPWVPENSVSYEEEKNHSRQVDAWLGFEIDQVEASLLSRNRTPEGRSYEAWTGLCPQSLMTPYTELRRVLKDLAPEAGERLVDLGAAYGRLGFVLGTHYPEVEFLGYELVQERVEEANRRLSAWKFPRVKLDQADLQSKGFQLVRADYYFLYDYGSPEAVTQTLMDLKKLAQTESITVVGRGRRSRDLIEKKHPWLSQVISPEHHPHYSIYRSS